MTVTVRNGTGTLVTISTIDDLIEALPDIVEHVPVGGSIAWAKTVVALTGSSQTVLASNAARKGIELRSPSGNDLIAWDKAGGTVTLTTGAGILALGGEYLTGDDCPLGAITAIGTAGQNLLVWEGV